MAILGKLFAYFEFLIFHDFHIIENFGLSLGWVALLINEIDTLLDSLREFCLVYATFRSRIT